VISSKYKFIFLHVPKSAGTSIEHAFGTPFASRGDCSQTELFPKFKGAKYHKHRSLNQMKRFLNGRGALDVYRDFFKFTFVRNPFDLIRSWYNFHKSRTRPNAQGISYPFGDSLPDTFGEFVLKGAFSKEVFQKQYAFDLFGGEQVGDGVDFVGKFENLEKDFQLISRITGVNCKLPHVNRLATKPPYWVDYTYEMRDVIERVFKEDLETFDYCF
jgi:hypothetical protein